MKINCNFFCFLFQQVQGGQGQADPRSHKMDGDPMGMYGSPGLRIPAIQIRALFCLSYVF